MVYNGKSKRIKNALKAIATDLQYNDEPAFQEVLGSNAGAFNGYPNLQILPGDISTEHVTTGESDHAPAYILRVRIPLEDTNTAQETAVDKMYDLTDLLIDAIEDQDTHMSLTDDDGLIAITKMDAARGDWLEVPASNGANLVCDVNVQITYSKDLS